MRNPRCSPRQRACTRGSPAGPSRPSTSFRGWRRQWFVSRTSTLDTGRPRYPPRPTNAGTTSGSSSRPVSRPAGSGAPARVPKLRRGRAAQTSGVHYPRWFWPSFAAPAILWLLVFFLLPLYTVLAIAFGTVDPIFRGPLPVWQPWWWTTAHLSEGLDKTSGNFQTVYARTFVYVLIASAMCLVLGYAIAYYVARYAGRRRTLLLVLLISPLWISYLMRMLAWINLLQPDGYVNRILTFLQVTLPLSRPAILAGLVIVMLPMFGDYFTNTLLSGSPSTTMIGNLIDDSIYTAGQGPEAAVLILILMLLLLISIGYYLRSTARTAAAR